MDIVRTDIPITSQSCETMIRALAEKYPFIRTETVAVTDFQRSVTAMVIGRGDRQVIFTAAHHANEWITALILLKFAEELARAIDSGGKIFGVPAATLNNWSTIHIIPMVDPDGVDLVVGAAPPEQVAFAKTLSENYPQIPFPDGWKANLAGVDLNLQYPAGWLQAREIKFSQGFTRPGPRDYVGRAPLDQPETRALADYTLQVDPALVLAFHTQGEEIYWKFRDYEIPGAKELGEEFARLSGYTLADTPYESAFAGYKDWFIQQFRRPGFTIEAGKGTSPLPIEDFPKIYKDNLGILTTAATGLPGGI